MYARDSYGNLDNAVSHPVIFDYFRCGVFLHVGSRCGSAGPFHLINRASAEGLPSSAALTLKNQHDKGLYRSRSYIAEVAILFEEVFILQPAHGRRELSTFYLSMMEDE